MLFIPLQLLLKLGLIPLTWRGLSGSCGSAEADWLDLPPSWGLSADTEQVWLLLRHRINRRKREIFSNIFKCFFSGRNTLKHNTDMCCKPSATLEGQPLVSSLLWMPVLATGESIGEGKENSLHSLPWASLDLVWEAGARASRRPPGAN